MYKAGLWYAICDVCGRKHLSSEIRKRWDGLMVCSKDYEEDHPQKYLRVREDTISVPWVRNEPADTFRHVCIFWTTAGMADFGTADCAQADLARNIESLIELFYPCTYAIADIAIADCAISGVA